MTLKDRFFSVLTELARQAKQPMPLEQWQKYLVPGKTLVRGNVRFPLRADEVRYGPLSVIKSLADSPYRSSIGFDDPNRAISPDEMVRMLENQSTSLPKLQTLLPGRIRTGYEQGDPLGRTARSMHYENQYQLPGEKLGQAEELTLLPGSDFVPSSSHFGGQPGLVSWSRTTRRPVVSEGAKTRGSEQYGNYEVTEGPTALHLEEIQSDWHQRAREEGYGEPDLSKWTAEAYPDHPGTFEVRTPEGGLYGNFRGATPEEAIRNAAISGERYKGVPYAPYKDTYAELELRKGLARAVENGDSYVTWTTGDQQADRWGQALRNSVDSIEWQKTPEGKYNIVPLKGGMPQIQSDERFTNLTEDQLEDLLGMDIAKKVKSGEGAFANEGEETIGVNKAGEIAGDNLTVGGSGMRLFYDRKVPEAARKLAAQYGGEVTKVKLPGVNTSPFTSDQELSLNGLVLHDPRELSDVQFNRFMVPFQRGIADTDEEFSMALGDVEYGFNNFLEMRHGVHPANPVDVEDAIGMYNDAVGRLSDLAKQRRGTKTGEQEVWALKITPEMRKKVLEAGLPLFSAGALAGVGTGLYGETGEPVQGTLSQGYATGGQVKAVAPKVPDYFHLPLHPWLRYFGLDRPRPPRLVGDPARLPEVTTPAAAPAAPATAAPAAPAATPSVPALYPSTLTGYALPDLPVAPAGPESPPGAVQGPAGDLANTGGTTGAGAAPAYLAALAAAEGGRDPTAPVSGSTALGPFRFTVGTWADVAKAHPELGLTPEGRTDPAQALKAAVAFTTDNAAALAEVGAAPTDANLRVLHVLGRRGGPALLYALETDPNGAAVKHASAAAVRANPDLFYDKKGNLVSVRQLYANLTKAFPGGSFADAYLAPAAGPIS